MGIEWGQLLATYGIGGGIVIVAFLWIRKRINDGFLTIPFVSKTAAELMAETERAKKERDAALERAKDAERCLRCATDERDRAQERYIARLEQLSGLVERAVNGNGGSHEND